MFCLFLCQHEEANQLRDELVEKAEMINSLTRSLDSSQKQCQEILKSGTSFKTVTNSGRSRGGARGGGGGSVPPLSSRSGAPTVNNN